MVCDIDQLLEFDNVSMLVKERLSAGSRVKNRKAMCEILGMDYVRGNHARDKDEKIWARLFGWVKEGNAYVVTEVFTRPLPEPFDKRDLFSANNLIALSALRRDDCTLSKKKLYRQCGYVSPKWNDDEFISDYLTKFAEKNGYSFKQTQHFFKVVQNHVSGYCGQHLDSSLARITERGYLTAEKNVMVMTEGEPRDRRATRRESEAYFDAAALVRKKKGRNLILTKEWDAINGHLRDVLNLPNMVRMYEAYRLYAFDRELIGDFCNSAGLSVEEAKRVTNERVVNILKGRMPKEVKDSNYRLAVSMYGEDRLEHGTAVTVPLQKAERLLEQDRVELIDALVAI